MCSCLALVLSCVVVSAQETPPTTPAQHQSPVLLILFDSSYGMREKLQGKQTKLNIGKQVVSDMLSSLPSTLHIGLRLMGQRFTRDVSTDCSSSKLVVPIATNQQGGIRAALSAVKPTGLTPLEYSLGRGMEDLRHFSGRKMILIVSDGAETCDGNPAQYVQLERKSGETARIDAIDLAKPRDKPSRKVLTDLVKAGSGMLHKWTDSKAIALDVAEFFELSPVETQSEPERNHSVGSSPTNH